MNNRNLEYEPPHMEMVSEALKSLGIRRRGVEGFLSAIMSATPNGEWIKVQYHPNGDWSVAAKPELRPSLVCETRERMAAKVKTPAYITEILKGKWDDTPNFRKAYGELWKERNQ